MSHMDDYFSESGHYEPVFTVEVQAFADDVDRILDSVMAVHRLSYGRYERNASVSAVGRETSKPLAGSTTDTHANGFEVGDVETYPMVEIKISIERDVHVLQRVTEAILDVHSYEQPVIFVHEGWASRSNYDPDRSNPNRWWNNGRGLPEKVT